MERHMSSNSSVLSYTRWPVRVQCLIVLVARRCGVVASFELDRWNTSYWLCIRRGRGTGLERTDAETGTHQDRLPSPQDGTPLLSAAATWRDRVLRGEPETCRRVRAGIADRARGARACRRD